MAKSVLVWAALAVAVAENCAAALLQTQSTATLHMAQMRPSARNCVKLFEDVCDFKVEDQEHRFVCQYEHASRMVYAAWIRPDAKVLEVGARYGQATCLLSDVLGLKDVANGEEKTAGSALVSVDADPMVWDILEANLAKHKCNAQVVRGTVGSKSFKIITPEDEYKHLKHLEGYARFTADANDPRPGILVPAHSLQSLNVTFDTLAIDCEGCFAAFLEENPELLQSLTMIIVEAHGLGGEDKVVAKLQSEGWELRHKIMDQRVLCKGPCESFCDLDWVEAHARKYYGKRFV